MRVYDNCLTLFLGHEQVPKLELVYITRNSRACSVNYQHIIDALVKILGLLGNLSYVKICFPTTITKTSGKACFYTVKLLRLARQSGHQRQLKQYVL